MIPQCLGWQRLTDLPSTGALLGSVTKQSIIDSINRASGSNVYFGQASDPIASEFQTLKRLIVNAETQGHMLFNQVKNLVNLNTLSDAIIPINTIEELRNVPQSMWMPILTYEPIRKLHQSGAIFGYGLDPDCVPEEDVYGRLIHNGESHYNVYNPTKFISWEFSSNDPKLSIEDLENIEATRGFIDRFLNDQLSENGELLDPTNVDMEMTVEHKRIR